jgi:hypothetical protein
MSTRQRVLPGLILILIGIWALLQSLGIEWLRMDRFWPIILIGVGLVSLFTALTSTPPSTDGVWFGLAAGLAGGLFLYITIGPASWSDMTWLWPAFPAIIGIAWVVAWLVNIREVSNLVAGGIALVVAGIGYLYVSGWLAPETGRQLLSLWPLILVVIGLGFIVQFWVSRRE